MAARALPAVRYVVGVCLLGAAYYAAGRASLALQYTGPVAAIWLPVGVGAATLYLAGLRWFPGVVIADLALGDTSQPAGTLFGITAGKNGRHPRHRAAAAPPARPAGRAGSSPSGGRNARRDRGRRGDHGNGGDAVLARRRGHRVLGHRGVLAKLVARGRIRLADRDPAGPRLGTARVAILARPRRVGGDRDDRRGRRVERHRALGHAPADLPRVPGADLGRAALRATGRDGRGRGGHGGGDH